MSSSLLKMGSILAVELEPTEVCVCGGGDSKGGRGGGGGGGGFGEPLLPMQG